jgi:stage II sporulation protein D
MPVMHRPLVALLLALAPLIASAQQVEVRVLLERSGDAVLFEIEEGHRGYAGERLLFDTPLGIGWPIAARDGMLIIGGDPFHGPFTLAPGSSTLTWRGNEYRGALRFLADADELLVVNVVDLEEYLRGVVPAEMAAAWPLEALKAQAVASRTYTLTSLDTSAAYDICATVECQRYLGLAAEHLRSDRAIAETAGLVLTYGGEFARTYYHSDSGGSLASSAEVWGTAVPYLASRNDVAASTPHRSWRLSLDPSRLGSALAGMGHDIGTVRALSVSSYSDSGRAQRAEIVGTRGRVTLAGSTLTSLLRAGGLKSTRFTMVGDLTAQGDGFGHGVGMSQYGARSLANGGYGFERILRFYYPETQLQRLASGGDGHHP